MPKRKGEITQILDNGGQGIRNGAERNGTDKIEQNRTETENRTENGTKTNRENTQKTETHFCLGNRESSDVSKN